jgi:hypothetical protein
VGPNWHVGCVERCMLNLNKSSLSCLTYLMDDAVLLNSTMFLRS